MDLDKIEHKARTSSISVGMVLDLIALIRKQEAALQHISDFGQMQDAAPAAPVAATDELRNKLMHAAIDCGHAIGNKEITLYRDDGKDGNALHQLAERLIAAAIADPKQHSQPVHQFRKTGTADWYDGHPDNGDGGGPYEIRTLYSDPQQHAQAALSDETLEILHKFQGMGLKEYMRRARAILATRQPAPAELPIELELPEGDKREAKVWWHEIKDGKRHICISVSDSASVAAAVAHGEIIGWYKDMKIDAHEDSQNNLPPRWIDHRAIVEGEIAPSGGGWRPLIGAAKPPEDAEPAKRPVPPRDQALCNDGNEPDWKAYAQAEEAAQAIGIIKEGRFSNRFEWASDQIASDDRLIGLSVYATQPSPHSIGYNDDLPEGWKRAADGCVIPPAGIVSEAYAIAGVQGDALSQKAAMPCQFNEFSSRRCERGTRGCHISHGPVSYASWFEQGRAAGIEDAAKLCETKTKGTTVALVGYRFAEEIRALNK